MLKVLLAGGGTAGHVNPALAIAEIIKERYPDTDFMFVGTPDHIESELVPKAGYKFTPMKIAGFQRQINFHNLIGNTKAVGYLLASGAKSKKILSDFKPDLVIGTGGYVSGPIVKKAAQMGIKTAIHEQNAYPGVTTRLLTKYVDKVMLTVEKAAEYFDKGVEYTVTGLPVRSAFKTMSKQKAREELGLDDKLCILSTGGSLGAGAINSAVCDLIEWYERNGVEVNHIHSYGGMGKDTFLQTLDKKGVEYKNNKRYTLKQYIDNMPSCMAAADLIISRCGANALCEIECVGRASILVPSPIVAGNHQYHNGMVLADAGAAVCVEQKNFTSELLIKKVEHFINNPDELTKLSENARKLYIEDTADRVFEVLSSLIEK